MYAIIEQVENSTELKTETRSQLKNWELKTEQKLYSTRFS